MGYFNSIYAAGLPHRAVSVYMYLKDRTNKDGTCWPSIRTIAGELQLSRNGTDGGPAGSILVGTVLEVHVDRDSPVGQSCGID